MPNKIPTFRPPHLPPATQGAGYERRRGSASARGYGWRWQQASKRYLAEHALCVGCEAVGRVVLATCTDHVIPHRGDAKLFWRRSNWQSSCDWHHDTVKQLLERGYSAGELRADDMRLDSDAAKALTLRLDAGGVEIFKPTPPRPVL